MSEPTAASGFPRLTYLRIKNYRALHDVELRDLTPLTVFIGPNGSGKSTLLDALAFLAEAVSGNLQQAWEKRNRFAGMRTRGQEGPIEFEVGALVNDTEFSYKIVFSERKEILLVIDETMTWLGARQRVFYRDQYSSDLVNSPDSELEKKEDRWLSNQFRSDITGIANGHSALQPTLYYALASGGFDRPKADSQVALARLLASYRLIHLTDDHLKGYSDAGPREKLSGNGDNLPNVLYYLHERHPAVLARITAQLRRWVPQLAEVVTEITSDERLLLRFKDAAFEKPLPAQYMSEGTMRLAALLTLLYEPGATGLLGLEEPENELHPRLLPRLAEELIQATETRQLLVATHSPALLNSMEPEQVWILHRGADGYTQVARVADMPDIVAMVQEGSPLGYLWSRNFFEVGDPLASSPSQPV